MSVTLLHPLAALLAVGAVVPLAVLAAMELRARRLRSALSLAPPRRGWTALAAVAVTAVAALLGIAAAQPVAQRVEKVRSRADAAVFFVLDTSRSMLASTHAGGESRWDRARSDALELRAAIPGVPAGLSSLTNRLLPHLFPTSDEGAFVSMLDQSMGVERPPPDRSARSEITTYAPLAALQLQNYFPENAARRVAVVLTDGETQDRSRPGLLREALRLSPHLQLVFVHVSKPGERVFSPVGLAELTYHADPASGSRLRRIAAEWGGREFEESQLAGARQALLKAVGHGRDEHVAIRRRSWPLAPWFVLAAVLPAAVILRRNNL